MLIVNENEFERKGIRVKDVNMHLRQGYFLIKMISKHHACQLEFAR